MDARLDEDEVAGRVSDHVAQSVTVLVGRSLQDVEQRDS